MSSWTLVLQPPRIKSPTLSPARSFIRPSIPRLSATPSTLPAWQPYRVEKDKLIAVNKKLKKHALWSEKRSRSAADGGSERRKSKKIKTEA